VNLLHFPNRETTAWKGEVKLIDILVIKKLNKFFFQDINPMVFPFRYVGYRVNLFLKRYIFKKNLPKPFKSILEKLNTYEWYHNEIQS